MRPIKVASALLAGALGLGAAAINDSSAGSQLLDTGDELLFTVSEWSYHVNAASLALPSYPGQVTFQFISQPETGPDDFTAWLETPDGSVVAPFPGVFTWLSGQRQSSGYTGPISALYGSMNLSPNLAAELFSGTSAVLVLENLGGPVEVGLPPYTLGQDLSVTFSRGGFGVNGPLMAVQYQEQSAVPEPDYRYIVPVLGFLLWWAPRAANRIARRRIQ